MCRRLLVLGSVLAGLFPVVCSAQPASEPCARLKEAIPASIIGLPSGGATIESAELVSPSPLTQAQLPFGPLPPYLAVVPAAPNTAK